MTKYPATADALECISALIGHTLKRVVNNLAEAQKMLQSDVAQIQLLTHDLQPLVTLLREVAFILKEGCECDDTKQN